MARPKGRGGSEVLDKLVTAAFVQALFTLMFPEAGDLIARFLYAINVTVIVVFATIRLGRLAEQAKERGCWSAFCTQHHTKHSRREILDAIRT
jgi:hypothetical protein